MMEKLSAEEFDRNLEEVQKRLKAALENRADRKTR